MPKVLVARLPIDAAEERAVRKLAGARHAPGDWIRRARIVVASWEGKSVKAVAAELGCHPRYEDGGTATDMSGSRYADQ